MTIHFKQKVRKWRGRTSHGWGAKKKHRGGGSQGGRGFAGLHKHKYSTTVNLEEQYFGFRGFTALGKRQKSINVGDLEKIDGGKTDINLTRLGYGKLLARGQTNKAYTINVKKVSERAKKKIEDKGGKVTGVVIKVKKEKKIKAVKK